MILALVHSSSPHRVGLWPSHNGNVTKLQHPTEGPSMNDQSVFRDSASRLLRASALAIALLPVAASAVIISSSFTGFTADQEAIIRQAGQQWSLVVGGRDHCGRRAICSCADDRGVAVLRDGESGAGQRYGCDPVVGAADRCDAVDGCGESRVARRRGG